MFVTSPFGFELLIPGVNDDIEKGNSSIPRRDKQYQWSKVIITT